jgi:trk system potassium uptake protein TrkH
MKDSKLAPRIAQTAKNLWLIYSCLTLACIVSLRLVGMSWFDALCHGMAALSLGGFSTHDASIGYFDSVAIELVLSFFMLVAATNFAIHFVAWRNKSITAYYRHSETMAMLFLVLASIIILSVYLWIHDIFPFFTALRHVSFNLISLATDSGFVSQDYSFWPMLVPLWFLIMSCICASSGSTGGGIKMIRTLIIIKQSWREMGQLLHPSAYFPLKINRKIIPDQIIFAILGFLCVYFLAIMTATFVLMFSGLDFISSFSAAIACINNAGPGLGEVGPGRNYAELTTFQTWVLTVVMLIGRLEVFTILILFTPQFWRK